MKRLNRLIFILSIALCLVFNTKVMAQQVPSLDVIATKVLQATVPGRSYTVTINQTINAPNKSKTKQAIDNGLFRKAIQFNAKYAPHIGLEAQKVIDGNNIAKIQKFKAQSSTKKPTLVKQGDVRVVIDFSTIFKNINEWQDVKITSVNFNYQKYFKVSARNKRFSYTLWINTLNYYVSKSILYVDNKIYAEVTLHYKHINNQYWLPVSLICIQYPERTQVIQSFSSYIFK